MSTLYTILVFIHVFSAILGIGPGLVLTIIAKSANTMTELRHAYAVRRQLHTYVMIGGTLLLVTGLLMGLINTNLFYAGWYVTSLLLFLIALALGPLVLAPRSKPIKNLLQSSYKSEKIPEEYVRLSKELFRYEYLENFLIIVIIVLMILKPF